MKKHSKKFYSRRHSKRVIYQNKLPNFLCRVKGLTHADFMLLAFFHSIKDSKGNITMSQKNIANILGISTRQISKSLKVFQQPTEILDGKPFVTHSPRSKTIHVTCLIDANQKYFENDYNKEIKKTAFWTDVPSFLFHEKIPPTYFRVYMAILMNNPNSYYHWSQTQIAKFAATGRRTVIEAFHFFRKHTFFQGTPMAKIFNRTRQKLRVACQVCIPDLKKINETFMQITRNTLKKVFYSPNKKNPHNVERTISTDNYFSQITTRCQEETPAFHAGKGVDDPPNMQAELQRMVSGLTSSFSPGYAPC